MIGLLANLGFGGIVVSLILTKVLVPKWFVDKLEAERDAYKNALEIERQRNTELSETTGTTARLIGALTDIALERHERHDAAPGPALGRSQQAPGEGSP